jgi:parallel beta-helix repeat protein
LKALVSLALAALVLASATAWSRDTDKTILRTQQLVASVLASPTPLKASFSSNGVAVSWSNITGETGFVVERRHKSTEQFLEVGRTTVDVTVYIDQLTTSGIYQYRVRAYSGSGTATTYSRYTNTAYVNAPVSTATASSTITGPTAQTTTTGTTTPTTTIGSTTPTTTTGSTTPTTTTGSTTPTTTGSTTPTTSTVTVGPGQQYASIQAAVSANPAGTTIHIKAGTYYETVTPKNGNVFLGEVGAVMDGGGGTAERHAFNGAGVKDVKIIGLTIQRYTDHPTPNLMTGVFRTRPDLGTTGWVIENCTIRNNVGAGIDTANDMIIRNNVIHGNTLLGIRGGLDSDRVIIEGNDIYNNNTAQSSPYGSTAFASAIKLYRVTNVTIRNNKIHDNYGFGVWLDMNWHHIVVDGNEIYSQRGVASDAADRTRPGVGIYWETSLAGGAITNRISRNKIYGQGDGIVIANSGNTEIVGNSIHAPHHAIKMFQTNRGTGINGVTFTTSNLNIHDNNIAFATGLIVAEDRNGWGDWENQNVKWDNNAYYLATPSGVFYLNGSRLSVPQWQARGHDLHSTFTLNGGALPVTPTTGSTAPITATAVAVGPGQQYTSIQAAVSANPAGTTFLIKAGTYHETVTPKNGNIFIGEVGAVMDGGGGTAERHAFNGRGVRDVKIKGLTIQRYIQYSPGPGNQWLGYRELRHLEQCGCGHRHRQ